MREPKKPAEPELPLDLSARTPEEIWQDYFKKRKPKPSAVRDLVLKLHNAKKHDHVIACIGAALVNNQAQPWMYEVLALSMEIAGRPKEEVERAIYSAVDLSGVSFPNVMMSAAYLTRFDRPQAALHMYRQASRVMKTRPEPYVMGLKLARKLNDYDAIRWAMSGILMYAWTKGYENLHKEAEDIALVAEEELRKAGKPRRSRCHAGRSCRGQAAGLEPAPDVERRGRFGFARRRAARFGVFLRESPNDKWGRLGA